MIKIENNYISLEMDSNSPSKTVSKRFDENFNYSWRKGDL